MNVRILLSDNWAWIYSLFTFFFKSTLESDFMGIKNCSEQEKKNKSLKLSVNLFESQLAILNAFMEDCKPYLNEACSMQSLSEQTDIPMYQLSNLLNCKLEKTFPDFINENRIHVAKRMLLSIKSDTVTIETIATECGFGSKSAFNRAFKKINNNLTPTEFIRQHKAIE